ncbi:OLC1v1018535C1 [Oldenlandia corymbosa var. corymbosa]|uniref:OLC1v1018535C1 n=1 Tax=Oldenlandia corymbosa var. corymbosa TaxID=529605 RepID=A0AAV1EBY0_OLDCO|nr:OLC1v1018535C1 [Oldenlandia corymbosa var. corymbosa]
MTVNVLNCSNGSYGIGLVKSVDKQRVCPCFVREAKAWVWKSAKIRCVPIWKSISKSHPKLGLCLECQWRTPKSNRHRNIILHLLHHPKKSFSKCPRISLSRTISRPPMEDEEDEGLGLCYTRYMDND